MHHSPLATPDCLSKRRQGLRSGDSDQPTKGTRPSTNSGSARLSDEFDSDDIAILKSIKKSSPVKKSSPIPTPGKRPRGRPKRPELPVWPGFKKIRPLIELDPEDFQTEVLDESWQRVWQSCLALFQTSPHDLFTWGLRLPSQSSERQEIYRELCLLIPHLAWQGHLSKLRFALQMAICAREHDHMLPAAPLSEATAASLLSLQNASNKAMLTSIAFGNFIEVRDNEQGILLRLFHEMKEVCKDRSLNFVPDQVSDRVFYLTATDVKTVTSSLDRLHRGKEFSHCVLTYCTQFAGRLGSVYDELPPSNNKCLSHWEQICAHNRERDALAGLADIPYAERAAHQQIAYWEAPACDPRFRQCLFDDFYSLYREPIVSQSLCDVELKRERYEEEE
ncbi:hypothetical protein F4808DRAFT_469751 [Astrocystis sublimbata]|nr:hypothetical protein F4808DRAFT_469751 [Astrocystis sublimbata]